MKFKVGDRVRRINCDWYEMKVGDIGIISDVGVGYHNDGVRVNGVSYILDTNKLEAVMKTLDNLEVGDELVWAEKWTDRKHIVRVLAVIDELVFLSTFDDKFASGAHKTRYQLKRDGYKVHQPQPTKVKVVVEGKETMISRESAEALNLV